MNPSCKEGALYIIHEYINVNLIQPSKIVIFAILIIFSSQVTNWFSNSKNGENNVKLYRNPICQVSHL